MREDQAVPQRRPDWDKEGRERRAREHGRESASIDAASVEELDAVLVARKKREVDDFDRLSEPARLVASKYRGLGKSRGKHRAAYLGQLHAAVEAAVAAAATPALKKRLQKHGASLEKWFFKLRSQDS